MLQQLVSIDGMSRDGKSAVLVSEAVLRQVDMLVEAGLCKSRTEALEDALEQYVKHLMDKRISEQVLSEQVLSEQVQRLDHAAECLEADMGMADFTAIVCDEST
jgi:metal-responsive CopG/Arc/MetJ family transcriptional regulator